MYNVCMRAWHACTLQMQHALTLPCRKALPSYLL